MKTRSKFLILILLLFGNVNILSAQCGGNIDFSTDWSQKGPTSSGSWTVSNGGSTVTQSINGLPTFYVSDVDYIDVNISGTIKVNTSGDDDFVGFVFGYHNPDTPSDETVQKYYLFDWKQAPQPSTSSLQEGFRLTKIDTTITDFNDPTSYDLYWHNIETNSPGFDVIDSIVGPNTGWNDFQVYNFTLTYTSKLIVIQIDGDTIFNVPGCYQGGKFGFYNLSQSDVIYSDFSYQLIPDFDFSQTDACINQPIDFNAVNNACFTGGYISPITSWTWDMGDGTIINDTNITYSYTTPGTYPVTLTVEDNFGCQTPITKDLVVKGLVAHQNDTVICPSTLTDVWCNLAVPGALYQWFKDGIAITPPTVNDTILSTPMAGTYTVEITGVGTYLCNTTSNSVTIIVENKNLNIVSSDSVVCSGANVVITANNIAGADYSWQKDGTQITGENSTTISTNQTGNYQANILTDEGCTFSSNTLVLNSGTAPIASISTAITHFCQGGSSVLNTTLQSGETVIWQASGSAISGATSASYTASSAGSYTAVITNSDGCTDESNSINITFDSEPNATLTQSEPNFCPGITQITLNSSIESGGSYAWLLNGSAITGAVNDTYDANTAGGYQVIVTNALGCVDTSSATTLQNATVSIFTVNFSDSTFCDGNSANLSLNTEAGSTYQWYNGVNTAGNGVSINVNNSGTYYAVVTNSFGCSTNSDTSTITVLPLPTASIATGVSNICSGDSTQISATIVPSATYEWFKDGASLGAPSFNNTLFANAIGNYHVIVRNACENTSNTITVGQSYPPSAAGTIYGYNSFCAGETLDFDINNVSGASSYNWELIPAGAGTIAQGQGTTDVTVNTTGQSFTIKVTPNNTCGSGTSSSEFVSLGDPTTDCAFGVLFFANETNICEGETIQFYNATNQGTALTPTWAFGAGASPSSAIGFGPISVTYSTSGLKTVTLSYVDGFGNVFYSNTKTDYINVTGSVNTSAIAGNNTVNCGALGEIYSVTNTPGSSYSWSVPTGATIVSGQGTNTITVNFTGTSGNITVQETTTSGCVGNAVTYAVNINSNVNTPAIAGDSAVNCGATGETYAVTNTAGSTYNWSVPSGATIVSGQGTNSIVVDFAGTSGNITVQETSAAGCVGDAVTFTININNGVNTSAISGSNSVKCDSPSEIYSVTNTAGSTYNWSVPSGATIVSGQGTNSITVNFNGNMGNVTVQETGAGGCVGGSVAITVTCGNTGIAESKVNTTLSVYPNPASDMISFKSNINGKSVIVVFGLNGQVQLKQTVLIDKNFNLVVRDLAKGVHIGQIITNKSVYTFKFVKE